MGIEVACGRLETGHELVIRLDSHIALQGMTRSGKSSLTYAILAALCQREDVVVAGCDPTGLLLNAWRDHPRSEWRALGGGDLPHHAEVLEALVVEMEARTRWLLDQDLDKVPAASSQQPLILVVLEEYPDSLPPPKPTTDVRAAGLGTRSPSGSARVSSGSHKRAPKPGSGS